MLDRDSTPNLFHPAVRGEADLRSATVGAVRIEDSDADGVNDLVASDSPKGTVGRRCAVNLRKRHDLTTATNGIPPTELSETGGAFRAVVRGEIFGVRHARFGAELKSSSGRQRLCGGPYVERARQSDPVAIYLFLTAGMSIDAKDKDGVTAMEAAKQGGHQSVIDLIEGAKLEAAQKKKEKEEEDKKAKE